MTAVRKMSTSHTAHRNASLRTSSISSPPARKGTFSTAPNAQYTANSRSLQPSSPPKTTTNEATPYIARAMAQAS